jgi:hypothetical protein
MISDQRARARSERKSKLKRGCKPYSKLALHRPELNGLKPLSEAGTRDQPLLLIFRAPGTTSENSFEKEISRPFIQDFGGVRDFGETR